MSRQYTISDLAQMYDTTTRTIRYYEELGLLRPEREGSRRVYSERDRVRLQLILRGRRLGFHLDEIQELLDLYDLDPTEVYQLREVIRKGDEKLAQIEAQIRDLEAIREELLDLRARMERLLAEKIRGGAES
ncbi:MerR family transcriptional regulator [Kyrpidia spormannii]|uniref:MerR family transcriptional regulator n=3 Tax=Kyrpidia TaxID=1129704 RepID=A0A2K8N7H5_9BACL|nr:MULTISPECIES: MerR family DNA-binding transcriptional regulator [Kyrpidia]ADG05867.1 transcriptional regulator, MerR family [Kyrpidia tusciae DSM 2912]ATY85296.1 MerR family transcriptional regulator [Kyrpidia spormannii]MCL6576784.1 MerR family DNA-binding transcriptional regulator [Kyrpidia sp.]CAB3393175.1 Transcriptional regulator, MerR family [Kyrpidia spormannii]